MYTLYYNPGAASFRVHMALIETGADYMPDLRLRRQSEPRETAARGSACTHLEGLTKWS